MSSEYVLVSDLSYKLGRWRAQADAFARIIRSELRPTDYGGELPNEVIVALGAYDELAAQSDGQCWPPNADPEAVEWREAHVERRLVDGPGGGDG